jgi:hypothetical protein
LARESCGPNVSRRDVCAPEGPDVLGSRDFRPVLREDVPAERFDFALEGDLEARFFEAAVEPPDPCEE